MSEGFVPPAGADDGSRPALTDAEIAATVPGDDVVLAYVRGGALARYVEGVAARSAAFAEELEACIDGMSEEGMAVCDRARSWRAGRGAVPSVSEGRPVAEAKVAHLPPPRARGWMPLALAAALVLAALGGGAAVVHVKRRDALAEQAARARELEAKQAEIGRLEDELTARQREIERLQAEAQAEGSEAARAAVRAELERARRAKEQTKTNLSRATGGAPAGAGSGKATCTCEPLDPMCSCL